MDLTENRISQKNRSLLLFAGTTEGRKLLKGISALPIKTTVCVATEYGSELLEGFAGEHIQIHTGRVDYPGMLALLQDDRFDLVVDATHPYAVEVSRLLHQACRETGTEYCRVLRESAAEHNATYFETLPALIAFLNQTEGNILLTVGSRHLEAFTAVKAFSQRIYLRVLPAVESLEKCLRLGFSASHVLAMQGPFTQELNLALLRQYQIQILVTKDSGKAGGFYEKADAARQAGCTLAVMGRPVQETGYTLEEVIALLKERF